MTAPTGPLFPGTGKLQSGVLQRGTFVSKDGPIALLVKRSSVAGMSPYDTILSVNPWDESLARDEVAIKDYGMHEGVLKALVDAGIVFPPHRTIEQGYVTFPVVRLRLSVPKIKES